MLTILNRLRGTEGYWAKITGVILGLVLGLVTGSWAVGVFTVIGYVGGESFGWGKWIGGIINDVRIGNYTMAEDEEGRRNGIHWLATRLFPEIGGKYLEYCITALAIRGFYWFFLALLPLVVLGSLSFGALLVISLLLGIGFPASVFIGKYTADRFSYSYKDFKMIGAWEHSEVWYGLMQDVVILTLVYNLL